VVLAFPCNQFGAQEPLSESEIKKFALSKGATFPLFSKVDVNGPNTHPVYKYLKGSYAEKHAKPMEDITWNFAKFLISRDGYVVDKYTPHTQPMEMVAAIEALL